MSLPGLREITDLRRQQQAARRAREEYARQSAPRTLARKLPPLLEWIPSVSPKLRSPRHFAEVARRLARVARGQTIELAFSCPPRHGKSTFVLHFVVWLLIQRPDLSILYCMHSAELAKDQTEAMRAIARRAGLQLGKRQTKRVWTTAGGGLVMACGIKNPPTGAGFNVVIVDDPHASREAAESAAQCSKVVASYKDDLMTREVVGGTSHIIVHTRWVVGDLIGVMTAPAEEDDENAPEPFEYINLPALDERDRALAPWMWSATYLKRRRARLGPSFDSLFQGDPAPKGATYMGPPVWVDADDVPAGIVHAGGVDLARTAGARSDHFASIVYARDPSEDIVYVVDIEHERAPLTDKITDGGGLEEGFNRRVYRQQQQFDGCALRMYTGKDEQNTLDLYEAHRDFPVRIDGVTATTSKLARAEPFIAAWNDGLIRIVRGTRHAHALVAQVRAFTGKKGGVDDLVDAAVAGYDEAMAVVHHVPRAQRPRSPSDTRRGRAWMSSRIVA